MQSQLINTLIDNVNLLRMLELLHWFQCLTLVLNPLVVDYHSWWDIKHIILWAFSVWMHFACCFHRLNKGFASFIYLDIRPWVIWMHVRLIGLELYWRRARHIELLLVVLFDFELSFGRGRQYPGFVMVCRNLKLIFVFVVVNKIWGWSCLFDKCHPQVYWFMFRSFNLLFLFIGRFNTQVRLTTLDRHMLWVAKPSLLGSDCISFGLYCIRLSVSDRWVLS